MTENNARPRLTLLTEEQKHQVHQNALRLLSATGVRVDSPAVSALLASRLGQGRIDGNIIRH